MKIQVLKKGSPRVKASDPCPYLIEVPPEAAKK
jgi:hypothetical protein